MGEQNRNEWGVGLGLDGAANGVGQGGGPRMEVLDSEANGLVDVRKSGCIAFSNLQ